MERIGLSSGGSKVKDNNNLKYDKDYSYGYPWPPRYYNCSFCQREFKSAQALGGHMNIHRRDRARLRDQSPPNNNSINNNNNNNNTNTNDHIINNIDNNDPFCSNEFDQNPSLYSNPIPRNPENPRNGGNPDNPNPKNSVNQNNPNPNPNMNPSSSSFVTSTSNSSNIYAHQYSLVSLSLSSLPPPLLKSTNGESVDPTTTITGSRDLGLEQRVGKKWKYMSSSSFEQHHQNEVRITNNNGATSTTKEIVRLDLELCLGEVKEDLDLELRLGI